MKDLRDLTTNLVWRSLYTSVHIPIWNTASNCTDTSLWTTVRMSIQAEVLSSDQNEMVNSIRHSIKVINGIK